MATVQRNIFIGRMRHFEKKKMLKQMPEPATSHSQSVPEFTYPANGNTDRETEQSRPQKDN